MTAPITPDERAAMRERYTASRGAVQRGVAALTDVPRLLDALDTAEAEATRLRDQAAPVWDEDTVVEAVARALFRRAHPGNVAWDTLPVDEFGKEAWRESARDLLAAELPLHPATPKHLPVRPDRETIARTILTWYSSFDSLSAYGIADVVLLEWPGESRATVQAEALRDAADAAVAQDNNQGDWWDDDRQTYGTPVDWLRARADRLDPKEK